MRTLFCIVIVCTITINSARAAAQDPFTYTAGNSRVRSSSMGGAATALDGGFEAVFLNPGTFSLFRDRGRLHVTGVVDPVLPLMASLQEDNFPGVHDGNVPAAVQALKYAPKAIGLSYRVVDLALVFHEELYVDKSGGRFFEGYGFPDNHFHTAAMNFHLSSQINIGVSGTYYRTDRNRLIPDEGVDTGFGFSYGILLRPNELYQVGITYIELPNDMPYARQPFERIADESLNAGIAVMPLPGTVLTADVRNLTENDSPDNFSLQEFHFGAEFSRIPHLSLRGGWYNYSIEGGRSNVFSVGAGMLDLDRFIPPARRFGRRTFAVSYAFILEETLEEWNRWHMLQVGIQIR